MRKEDKLRRGPETLYTQMKKKILEIIEERSIQPHEPVPSEGELADLFGVSRRTSKQALQLLAEEGIVYRMPRRGTFLADPTDGSPRGSEAGRSAIAAQRRHIGLVVPEISDYIGQFMAEAIREVSQHGFEFLVRVTDGRLDQEDDILRELVNEARVDGIILFPEDRMNCGNELLRLYVNQFPVVIVDRIFKEVNIPSVYHDHTQGAYDITKLLFEHGHERIGFVSEPIFGVMSREERYHGFTQAYQEFNLPLSLQARSMDFSLKEATNPQTAAASAEKLETFLRDNEDMTAVFCSNDYVALYVYYAAQKLKIRVPEQLSLVGFTDLPISRLMPVPLTTVRKNTAELASAAIQLISERIAAPHSEPRHILLRTELALRHSIQRLGQ